jgi:4-amino-4-deoxy-L-arabinose transferase-like glycosyltransferase
MLFRARLAVSFFAGLLAVLVFLAAKEMFGIRAGFIALALLAFDPNFLAHGAVVGTDTGLSCFLFASIYAFYRYVKAPSAGLAISTKHTAILVFPMLALLAGTLGAHHRNFCRCALVLLRISLRAVRQSLDDESSLRAIREVAVAAERRLAAYHCRAFSFASGCPRR